VGATRVTLGSPAPGSVGAAQQVGGYVPTNAAGGDDAAVSALFASASVRDVLVDSGTCRVNATVIGANGKSLCGQGASRTKFVSYVASGGGPAGGCMQWTNVYDGGNASTLSATPTIGSRTLKSHGVFAVGTSVWVQAVSHAFEETIYTIRARTGPVGDEYTYTTERPISARSRAATPSRRPPRSSRTCARTTSRSPALARRAALAGTT
jgi:hypothetical protein